MGPTLKTLYLLTAIAAAGQAQAMIDPTAPPTDIAQGDRSTAPAVLAWVKVNGRQSIAWYGGNLVRLGDMVEGGHVSAIREDHIVISGRQGQRIVPLLDLGGRTRLTNKKR